MTDKTSEQIENEKKAIAAMTNAKAHMDAALSRIQKLELALGRASGNFDRLKSVIGSSARMSCYVDGAERVISVHDFIAAAQSDILKIK